MSKEPAVPDRVRTQSCLVIILRVINRAVLKITVLASLIYLLRTYPCHITYQEPRTKATSNFVAAMCLLNMTFD